MEARSKLWRMYSEKSLQSLKINAVSPHESLKKMSELDCTCSEIHKVRHQARRWARRPLPHRLLLLKDSCVTVLWFCNRVISTVLCFVVFTSETD